MPQPREAETREGTPQLLKRKTHTRTNVSIYLEGQKQPREAAAELTWSTESAQYVRRHLLTKQRMKSTVDPENHLLIQLRKKVLSGNK